MPASGPAPVAAAGADERNGNRRFNPDADYPLKPGFNLIAMPTPVGRPEIEQQPIGTLT